MVSVVPVRDEEYLLVLCTLFATIGPGGQQREYYLSQEMCKVLEEVLTTLMNSDREMLRASVYSSLCRVSESVSTLDGWIACKLIGWIV